MPSNIEIKARLPDKQFALKIAREESQQNGKQRAVQYNSVTISILLALL